MATPQTENGYVRIATEIVDQFCRYRLSGEEWLLLWTIIRKTYGWNKIKDVMSLSQIQEASGLKSPEIIRARKRLLAKQLIHICYSANGQGKSDVTYSIQKDYRRWVVLAKQPRLAKRPRVVGRTAKKSLAKQPDTIDNTIDTNNRQDFSSFVNDVEMKWNLFCEDYPIMSKVKGITPDRRKKLKTRYENKSFRDFDSIIDAIKQQKFCRGGGPRKWKVTFDWIIDKDRNYMKVLEFNFKDGGDSVPESMRKFIKD